MSEFVMRMISRCCKDSIAKDFSMYGDEEFHCWKCKKVLPHSEWVKRK